MLASLFPQTLAARLLAALVLALALFTMGYGLGRKHEGAAREAAQIKVMQDMAARAAEQAQQDAALSATQEVDRERVRIVYRTLRQEVTRYVANTEHSSCGIDGDGLRLWNAANRGDAAVGPSEPVGAVPEPSAGAERTGGIAAGESPGRNGALPSVPDPPPGSGALDDPANAGW